MTIMQIPPQDRNYEHLRLKLEHLKRQSINAKIVSQNLQKNAFSRIKFLNWHFKKYFS